MTTLKIRKTFTSLAAALGLVMCLAAMPAEADVKAFGGTLPLPSEFGGFGAPGNTVIPGSMIVGDGESGLVIVDGGNQLTVDQADIDAGSVGTMVVDGMGSRFIVRGLDLSPGCPGCGLFIGNSAGLLVVKDGGVVDVGTELFVENVIVGFREGGTGTMVVIGDGSQFNMTGSLVVAAGETPEACCGIPSPGDGATASVDILRGGKVNADGASIGHFEKDMGTVNVIGQGSEFSVNETPPPDPGIRSGGVDSLQLGFRGDGTLNIADGGTVNGGAFVLLGNHPGGSGTVVVDGMGSLLTSRGVAEEFSDSPAFITVGRSGTGLLDIRNGGRVLIDPGLGAPPFPGMNVAGSSLGEPGGERTGILLIDGDDGVSQPSELRIANGTQAFFQVGRDDGSKGTLNITRGGRFIVENPDGAATSFISRKPDSDLLDSVPASFGAVIVDGEGTIGNHSLWDAGEVLGCGKDSDFLIPVTATLPGGTGTLTVRNGGEVIATTIVIGPGCIVSGDGLLTGTVINEGTILPGNSPGTLTIAGDMTHDGLLVMEIEGTQEGEFDRLAVSGTVTFTPGSTIQIRASDAVLQGAPTIEIIQAAAIIGEADVIVADAPPGGAVPSVVFDPAGIVAITFPVPDTTPPGIVASLAPVGAGDDGGDDADEGRFRIDFSASDDVDPEPVVTAVLVIPNAPEIAVTDGQVIEFEFDDEGAEIEIEDGILEIEAPELTLRVTATDASGNSAVAEVQPTGLAADNDDDTSASARSDDD